MFSALWREQGSLYCGIPLFCPWEQTPRLLGASGHRSIEFCERCCEVEQKSPRRADTLMWFVSRGVEFSKMQKIFVDFAASPSECPIASIPSR